MLLSLPQVLPQGRASPLAPRPLHRAVCVCSLSSELRGPQGAVTQWGRGAPNEVQATLPSAAPPAGSSLSGWLCVGMGIARAKLCVDVISWTLSLRSLKSTGTADAAISPIKQASVSKPQLALPRMSGGLRDRHQTTWRTPE